MLSTHMSLTIQTDDHNIFLLMTTIFSYWLVLLVPTDSGHIGGVA